MAYIDREQCLLQSRVTERELVVLGQDVLLCESTKAQLVVLGHDVTASAHHKHLKSRG